MYIVLYLGRMDISHGYFTNLRAGGNRVRKKEKWNPWLRAAWNIIYKMSYFSSTEFPLLHLSSFFSYKATFESAVLTTKTMNASTCQGSTRLHVCVMSHSPSSTGGMKRVGRWDSGAMTSEKGGESGVDAPTPSLIFEFQFYPWFSLLRLSPLRFMQDLCIA